MEEIFLSYWLGNIPGIGNATIKKILERLGTPRFLWEMSKDDMKEPGLCLSQTQIKNIITSRNEEKIIKECLSMRDAGINFLYMGHPGYPSKLYDIHNPPYALYIRGHLPSPSRVSISIVGARQCSEYGRYVTRKISESLGRSNIQIISGLARGVDCIAQKGALDVGGSSYAVLGCGPDICYPPENEDIYNRLISNGGIISEYPPKTAPKSCYFPMRNRIISGLSDVVVVIEAREKSGSLITADMALDQGRDVYALPGRVTDSCSHGCNRLIKQGAGIILSPEEFLEDLRVNYSIAASDSAPIPEYADLSFTQINDTLSKKILSVLSEFDPKSLTVIQLETGLSMGELSSRLLLLSMDGYVTVAGGRYMLSHRRSL